MNLFWFTPITFFFPTMNHYCGSMLTMLKMQHIYKFLYPRTFRLGVDHVKATLSTHQLFLVFIEKCDALNARLSNALEIYTILQLQVHKH